MKAAVFSLISLVFLGFSCGTVDRRPLSVPRIVHGESDFSGVDLQAGDIPLKGEWAFFPNQFISPGQEESPPLFVPVPSRWDSYILPDGKPFGRKGYASYRLVLKNFSFRGPLAFRVPQLISASRMYANGTLILSDGVCGKTAEETTPFTMNDTVSYNLQSDQLEIVLHLANFQDVCGAISDSLVLGTVASLKYKRETSIGFDTFLFGCIIIFCFHSFGLYLVRFKQIGSLFFGLFCLFISLRTLVTGENYLTILSTGFPWEWRIRLDFLSFYLGSPFFMLFLWTQFKKVFQPFVLFLSCGVSLIFSVLVLTTPVVVFAETLNIFQLFVIVQAVYCLYVITVSVIRKEENALISLGGFLTLFVAIINDILFTNAVIYSVFLTPFGFLGSILSHSFILSRKFVQNSNRAEELASAMILHNEELEQRILERTKDLADANREKTTFFINMAHETKTPLTIINNYLAEFIKKAPSYRELEIIKTNIEKLQRDMINFLDAEKLERGQVFYNHAQVIDFSDLVRKKVELFSAHARVKNQLLQSTVEDGIFVAMDPFAADRILNNLIDNAFKYTPREGKVTVGLSCLEDQVLLTVEDTGIGISPVSQENLFKPFQQLSSEKRNIQGIGMGLFIVKKIVDELGAAISVDSRENEGTRFCLRLPRAQVPATASVEDFIPSVPQAVSKADFDLTEQPFVQGRKTLLLVEDNPDMMQYLREALATEYNLRLARDGQEALEKLIDFPCPDLIVSDIMMDRMNGSEFFQRLKVDKTFEKVPFIFLTALSERDLRIKSLAEGAIDFIQKPFDIKELKAKIKTLTHSVFSHRQAGFQEAIDLLSNRLDQGLLSHPAGTAPKKDEFQKKCSDFLLTDRQREIVELVLQGMEYKEIAGKLALSLKTIGNHLQAIYEKTKVHNKVDLVRLFMA